MPKKPTGKTGRQTSAQRYNAARQAGPRTARWIPQGPPPKKPGGCPLFGLIMLTTVTTLFATVVKLSKTLRG